jgi:predicted transcriptional regulator
MHSLLELTAQIVSAHVSNIQMTSDEMLQELQKVYVSLKALEVGSSIAFEPTTPTEAPKLSIKQAFKKDEVICMVCGNGGFKTLKRHLGQAHNLKPGQYRKQFGIPSTQSLSAKSYSESRRQMAIDKGLGEGLAKFRADKKKAAAVPVAKTKAPIKSKKKTTAPGKIFKAPVPAVKEKAPVPAVRTKAQVPAVRKKAAAPAKVAKKK